MRLRPAWWKELRSAMRDAQDPENMRVVADVYWRALLVVALLAGLSSLVWGFILSQNVAGTLDAASSSTKGSPTPVNIAELNVIIENLAGRGARYDALLASPQAIADPSK